MNALETVRASQDGKQAVCDSARRVRYLDTTNPNSNRAYVRGSSRLIGKDEAVDVTDRPGAVEVDEVDVEEALHCRRTKGGASARKREDIIAVCEAIADVTQYVSVETRYWCIRSSR